MGPEIPWRRQLWHRWKALRNVPWRKKWFVGYDLEGNSYWELMDHNNPWKLRRKVEMAKNSHIADYRAVPQWMQWLRHARPTPPTVAELLADQHRQQQLRVLSQQADQRWRQVPTKSTDEADPRLTSSWTGSGAPVAAPAEELTSFAYPETQAEQRVFSAQQIIKERDAKRQKNDEPQQPDDREAASLSPKARS